MKRKNDDLEMMCRSCERAEILVDKDVVLCEKKGIVPANGVCRKFIYDALKRVPPVAPEAPKLEFVDIDSKD